MDTYTIGGGDTGKAIRLLSQLEMFGIIEKLGLTAEKITVADEETQEATQKLTFRYERDLMELLGRFKNEGKAYFTCDFADGDITKLYFLFEIEI